MAKPIKTNSTHPTLDFTKQVEPHMHWPDNEQFPLNRKGNLGSETVIKEIIKDINNSESI